MNNRTFDKELNRLIMKNLLLAILLVLLLSSCVSNDQSKENIELIGSYIEAVENLDFEAMDNILDDDYIGIGTKIRQSKIGNIM